MSSDFAHRRHWLPLQEINIESPEVKGLLNRAHQVADWVVTFDRLASARALERVFVEDGWLKLRANATTCRILYGLLAPKTSLGGLAFAARRDRPPKPYPQSRHVSPVKVGLLGLFSVPTRWLATPV